MPFLAPIGAWIAANAPLLEGIAAVASTAGATVGTVESIDQRNAAQQAYQQQLASQQQFAQQQQQQQQTAATAATQQQEKAAVARQYPNLQEQLGGAAAPDYLVQAATNRADVPGDTGIGLDAFRQFLGDRTLQLDPSKGGITSGAGTFWDTLQQQQSGADQVSGGLT